MKLMQGKDNNRLGASNIRTGLPEGESDVPIRRRNCWHVSVYVCVSAKTLAKVLKKPPDHSFLVCPTTNA
jgi:hypothetical protein